MQKMLLLILALSTIQPFSANAGELLLNDLSYSQGKYYMFVEAVINAPKERVLDILTDYNHLKRIDPKIIESGVSKNAEGQLMVYSTVRDCIFFICQDVINTQLVEIKGNTIHAYTVAEQSNLKDGYMKWQLTAQHAKTHIRYSAMLEPNFFVPSIIAPMILRQKLSKDAVILIESIERLALL